MTDVSLESMIDAAKTEMIGVDERLGKLRNERIRLNDAVKEAVTRKAYLQRVINAANPKPRGRKTKGDGQPQ